jgi:RNA polymerase sigma-70 factor, ECF subfamily
MRVEVFETSVDSEQIACTLISDFDLVERVLSGDTDLFGCLVRRYNRRLWLATSSILQGEHEVEDVIQEACLRAYDRLPQFAWRSSFSTWLTRIAITEARRKVRDHSKKTEMDAMLASLWKPTCGSQTAEQVVLTSEARRVLREAIDCLPRELRTVFVRHFLDETTITEISRCLEITRELARVRLLQARRAVQYNLYRIARATSSTAFQFLREPCSRVTADVRSRIEKCDEGGSVANRRAKA